jgi:hypothetical protein
VFSNGEIYNIHTAWAILRAVLVIYTRSISFAPTEFPPDGGRLI